MQTMYVIIYKSYTQIYIGKEGSKGTKDLGKKVVMNLLEPLYGLYHHAYFDNYFASVELLRILLEHKTYGCATILTNRKEFPEQLKNPCLKNR